MSKQIYIDSQGNENLISGTINTGETLPLTTNPADGTVSEAIGDLESGKSNLLTTEAFNTTFSVNANTDVAVNFDITKSGYTPLGVVFYTIANKDCIPHAIIFTNTTTATFHISNVSASAKTNISANITVLFVKN